MHKLLLTGAATFAAALAFAEITIVTPSADAVVPLLTDAQKAYVNLPQNARREKFADSTFRGKEMGLPAEPVPGGQGTRAAFWPKTVTLGWTAEGTSFKVRVADAKTGVQVAELAWPGESGFTNGATRCVWVDNLEIARTYEWSVTDGKETVKSSFRTEDVAPRLVRFPGVPNVRDLGGRIALNGRRVRQGRVFRSAGLNDNAHDVYYTNEELEKSGRKAELDAARNKAEARLATLKAWQENPGTMDRKDPEYAEWLTRHPNDPVAKFLSSRIERAKKTLRAGGDAKIVKGREAGKSRVAGANGDYVRTRFGIRSDIDLRSDAECYGMTGSPLGETVTWFHYSSSAYGGMQSPRGKKAFTQVFKVFLDEKNYPIDFHCIAGQDRTGAVAFILNALLGVNENQLYLDWETTGFWNRSSNFNHERLFDGLVKGFQKNYPAESLNASVEKYVLDLGFSSEDIAKFRDLMLE